MAWRYDHVDVSPQASGLYKDLVPAAGPSMYLHHGGVRFDVSDDSDTLLVVFDDTAVHEYVEPATMAIVQALRATGAPARHYFEPDYTLIYRAWNGPGETPSTPSPQYIAALGRQGRQEWPMMSVPAGALRERQLAMCPELRHVVRAINKTDGELTLDLYDTTRRLWNLDEIHIIESTHGLDQGGDGVPLASVRFVIYETAPQDGSDDVGRFLRPDKIQEVTATIGKPLEWTTRRVLDDDTVGDVPSVMFEYHTNGIVRITCNSNGIRVSRTLPTSVILDPKLLAIMRHLDNDDKTTAHNAAVYSPDVSWRINKSFALICGRVVNSENVTEKDRELLVRLLGE
jgi:hypothetical protein